MVQVDSRVYLLHKESAYHIVRLRNYSPNLCAHVCGTYQRINKGTLVLIELAGAIEDGTPQELCSCLARLIR